VSEDGLTRSAILLMSIGEEEAGEVFRYLAPRQVQKLGQAMARLSGVSREQAAAVLRACRHAAQQQTTIGSASDQYLRNVLTRALGADKAGMLLQRILQGPDNSGIENLKWMDAASVAALIGGEHPQIIAAVLAHLDAEQAAEVLKLLPERLRTDLVLRIAKLDGVQPAALQDLNEVLGQLLSGGGRPRKPASRGGVEAAAEVMNRLGGNIEAAVSAHIREIDPDLAQQIQDKMLVFDNLVDLDDRAIQLLLRELQSDGLIVALKGTSEAIKDKLFKNMSQRTAEMLRDDLDAKGPVRLSEIEAEQREILRIVRRLAEEGQIVLSGAGAEGLVE